MKCCKCNAANNHVADMGSFSTCNIICHRRSHLRLKTIVNVWSAALIIIEYRRIVLRYSSCLDFRGFSAILQDPLLHHRLKEQRIVFLGFSLALTRKYSNRKISFWRKREVGDREVGCQQIDPLHMTKPWPVSLKVMGVTKNFHQSVLAIVMSSALKFKN